MGFLVAGLALTAAAFLYFVVLPHIEGSSLDEQRSDKREVLVCCSKCGIWQSAEPISSALDEADHLGERLETNWFRCRQCNNRWSEKRFP